MTSKITRLESRLLSSLKTIIGKLAEPEQAKPPRKPRRTR